MHHQQIDDFINNLPGFPQASPQPLIQNTLDELSSINEEHSFINPLEAQHAAAISYGEDRLTVLGPGTSESQQLFIPTALETAKNPPAYNDLDCLLGTNEAQACRNQLGPQDLNAAVPPELISATPRYADDTLGPQNSSLAILDTRRKRFPRNSCSQTKKTRLSTAQRILSDSSADDNGRRSMDFKIRERNRKRNARLSEKQVG